MRLDGSSVQAITATTEHQTGVGTYDTWIGDVSIVSSDGAVTPVYRGQPVGSATWGVCDDNTGVSTEQTPVDGFAGTTYSAGDQVGTTQMEFAVNAWPIQRANSHPSDRNSPARTSHETGSSSQEKSETQNQDSTTSGPDTTPQAWEGG